MKRLLLTLIALVFCLTTIGSAFAHSSSQKGILTGNEESGWRIDESAHQNKSGAQVVNVTYRVIDNNGQWHSEYDTYLAVAKNKWKGTFNFYENSNSNNKIIAGSYGNHFLARLRADYTTDSNGHFTSWTLELNNDFYTTNLGVKLSAVTVAHELGHTLGLEDLYFPGNSNKIMYGYEETRTATNVTSYDRWGALSITGIHSHSITYVYYDRTSPTQTRHKKKCTVCTGVLLENCTYLSGICKHCGTSRIPTARK